MFTHENEQRETYTTNNGDEWQLATWTDEDGEWTGSIIFEDGSETDDVATADTREELLKELRGWAADFEDADNLNMELDSVMTPAEIEQRFGLASGTVRQAVNRDPDGLGVWYRRPDARTILISAEYAFERWEKPGEPYQIDAAMTGQSEAVAERAAELLNERGWNVEYVRGWNAAKTPERHEYLDNRDFDIAFWQAISDALLEIGDDE